ncbi:MAG TPA: CpsB/CapC family capsule biosynthesis tyrosine phosphatase [Polyangia bacterium]
MSRYVDLHAHYLAGVDDGSSDLATTQAMLTAVAELGFSDLYATPHQREGLYLPTRDAIDAAYRNMTDAVAANGALGIKLGLGAENFWDGTFIGRIKTDEIPSYDGGPAFLFEVPPPLMPVGIETTLFDIRLAGKLPVMAHPERYHAIQTQLERAQAIGQTAALVVDLAALDGAHGRTEMKIARELLLQGLAHAAATDIHGPQDIPGIAAGMAWIKKHLGADALKTLLDDNPRRILAGDLPERGR